MPKTYYNEIDKFAAAWLRELIKAGLIADGEIDERDIREVKASDLSGFTQCHFFAGIGVWSYALRLARWPDDRPVWTGSCPCPSFSAAGKGQGFADPRHLWPAWYRLIRECRPAIVFGEQVNAAIGHGWLDLVQSDLEAEGYAVGKAVLGACSVGAPHRRQRLYFVADAECDGGRTDQPRREAQGREVDGRDCATGRLADAGKSSSRLPVASCQNGELADAELSNWRAEQQEHGDAHGRAGLGRSCHTGELGDALLERRQQERGGASRHEEANGREGRDGSESDGNHITPSPGETGDPSPESQVPSPGFTSGFWADAEWLWCRDGKWRAVEPGTFPLAHGLPVSMARMQPEVRRLAEMAGLSNYSLKRAKSFRIGSLRGYGNALCAPVAQGFIEAYMESSKTEC